MAARTGCTVGIDVGTSNCRVATLSKDMKQVDVLFNRNGNRSTPCFISFKKGQLVGEGARHEALSDPASTVYDVQRLIGRDFADLDVEDLNRWPFEVIPDDLGKVAVRIDGHTHTLIEVQAALLREVKASAEADLGVPVECAVATVPASFNDAQRRATRQALEAAGLNCLRLINAAAASGMAHMKDKEEEEAHFVVFDFGAGTLDVSLLFAEDGIFEVLDTRFARLGGRLCDDRLVEYFREKFEREHSIDVAEHARALDRLRRACERAKVTLSSAVHASFIFEVGGQAIACEITRAVFEDLVEDVLRAAVDVTKSVIASTPGSCERMELVMSGGCSRIPSMKTLLREALPDVVILARDEPEFTAVAGAAMMACILSGPPSPSQVAASLHDLLLLDLTSITVGIETAGGVMTPIIPRNSTIPCKRMQRFTTATDVQTSVTVRVFEGEHTHTNGCHLLAEFTVSGIEPAPRGSPLIDVTFDMDVNGILTVSAVDVSGRRNQAITITSDVPRLSADEIARLIAAAEQECALPVDAETCPAL